MLRNWVGLLPNATSRAHEVTGGSETFGQLRGLSASIQQGLVAARQPEDIDGGGLQAIIQGRGQYIETLRQPCGICMAVIAPAECRDVRIALAV